MNLVSIGLMLSIFSAEAASQDLGRCDAPYCEIFFVKIKHKEDVASDPSVRTNTSDLGNTADKRTVECSKSAVVPVSVYRAVAAMMAHIKERIDAGAPPAAFTPAEQTMMLFYATILQQTQNFQCEFSTSASQGDQDD